MSGKADFRPYIIRLVVTVVASLVFVAAFNEGSYLLQREQYDRAPKTVQLVIPDGTAERVAAGEPVPSIPEEMVFVIGDVLEVKNEDSDGHQLGPLFVPAGGTARLVMEKAEKYAFACSFQPSRYLGLDVRQGTTLSTRLTALILATPAMAVFLFIYSLLVYPVKAKATAGKTISGQAP